MERPERQTKTRSQRIWLLLEVHWEAMEGLMTVKSKFQKQTVCYLWNKKEAFFLRDPG